MQIHKYAQTFKKPSAEEIAALADTLRIYRAERINTLHTIPKDVLQRIDSLPSRHSIIKEMGNTELKLTRECIDVIWKKLSGESLPKTETIPAPESATDLDGNFWMIPGGIFLRGYNHYTAAKNHKNLLCSILNINPWIFEKRLHGSPQELIKMIIANGGIRVNIDRKNSQITTQCNQEAWSTVVDKLRKMYHKNKISRIIDMNQPYHGWQSGIPVKIG